MLMLTATSAASIWTCFSVFNYLTNTTNDCTQVSRIKKAQSISRLSFRKMAATYSPANAVPSAQMCLTSLFGMGRGDPHCNNHHKL